MSCCSINGHNHGADTSTFDFFLGGGGRQIKEEHQFVFSAVTVTAVGWVLLVPHPKPFTKQMLVR